MRGRWKKQARGEREGRSGTEEDFREEKTDDKERKEGREKGTIKRENDGKERKGGKEGKDGTGENLRAENDR